MYRLPVKIETYFRDKREKNNVPKMTDLLRYWPMLEFFIGKTWEVDHLKHTIKTVKESLISSGVGITD